MPQQDSLEEHVRDIVRQEVEQRLRTLEERLGRVEGAVSPAQQVLPSQHVLQEVARRGGQVNQQEWHALGRAAGYDPRGLGGFFTGQRPSVRWADTNLIELTDQGWRTVRESALAPPTTAGSGMFLQRPLQRLGGRPLAEYIQEDRR